MFRWLIDAIKRNDLKCVTKILSNNNCTINIHKRFKEVWADYRTPLIIAAECGHVEILKVLLSTDKVDFTLKYTNGFSPLEMAVKHGHTAAVVVLSEFYSV